MKKSVYESLLYSSPCVPPESGGVIGGNDGIVNCFAADEGFVSTEFNRYQPNTDKLNHIISKWFENGINFMGIFHTHPSGDEKLSQADLTYIKSIMTSIKGYTNTLYFPIVIPKEKIIGFCAEFVVGEINIFQTTIEIL